MGNPTTTDYLYDDEPTAGPESKGQRVRSESLMRVEHRNRILKLRRDGLTVDQISETLANDEENPYEITPAGVKSAISRYIGALTRDDTDAVEELRHIDGERLERMFSRLELAFLTTPANDVKTRSQIIGMQLKVLERNAKLHGLDAPTKIEGNLNVNVHALTDANHVRKVEDGFARRHGTVIDLPTQKAIDVAPEDVTELADGDTG